MATEGLGLKENWRRTNLRRECSDGLHLRSIKHRFTNLPAFRKLTFHGLKSRSQTPPSQKKKILVALGRRQAEPCPWSRLGPSLVQVGHVPGPGWACPWSRLGMYLVQVGHLQGAGWECPRSKLGMSLVQVGQVPGPGWGAQIPKNRPGP